MSKAAHVHEVHLALTGLAVALGDLIIGVKYLLAHATRLQVGHEGLRLLDVILSEEKHVGLVKRVWGYLELGSGLERLPLKLLHVGLEVEHLDLLNDVCPRLL